METDVYTTILNYITMLQDSGELDGWDAVEAIEALVIELFKAEMTHDEILTYLAERYGYDT